MKNFLPLLLVSVVVGLTGCVSSGSSTTTPVNATPTPVPAALVYSSKYKNPVLIMDFKSLPAGFENNIQLTYPLTVLPTVKNDNNIDVQATGKYKVNIEQFAPDPSFSLGCLQFANNSYGDKGIAILKGVQGPFSLVVAHAPASPNDDARKLRVEINGQNVYEDGNGLGMVSVIEYEGTDVVDIQAYGWNGELGAGIRIFDIILLK